MPIVELLADELGPIVDADLLGIGKLGSTMYEGLDDVEKKEGDTLSSAY